MKRIALLLCLLLLIPGLALAKKKDKEEEKPETKLNADTLASMKLRGIGPAYNSGRVVDFAVTPGKRHRYFVATASGGLWKTDKRRGQLESGFRRRGVPTPSAPWRSIRRITT